MTFTVTYRGADGAPETDVVEAASRSDCLAQMRARGVAVLSVKEGNSISRRERRGRRDESGKNGRAESGRGKDCRAAVGSRGTRDRIAYVLFIALVVLAAGIGAWWWMDGRRGGEAAPQDDGPKKTSALAKEVKPTTAAKPVAPVIKPCDINEPPVVPRSSTTAEVCVADMPEFPVGVTNTPDIPPLPPQVFSNASDQALAMIVSADPSGMPPIPISHNIEAEFLASLKQEIVILDSDDEQTRSIKEAVKAAREEMKRLIDSGMSVAKVLAEHQSLANENAKVRNDAMLELNKILESGDIEGAKEYKQKINIALQQMGIAELTIPVTEEERAERAVMRRERMLKRRAARERAALQKEELKEK